MQLLDKLGCFYGTDKSSTGHDYLRIYETYLTKFQDQAITLFEMGVGGGHSLRLWKDYFPFGKIVGLDINDSKEYEESRINIEFGDQHNREDLERVIRNYGPFDIVVDDAGHHGPSQRFAYDILLPHVKPGGVYILEDIGDQEVSGYLSQLAKDVIHGQDGHRIETITFYRETTITRIRE